MMGDLTKRVAELEAAIEETGLWARCPATPADSRIIIEQFLERLDKNGLVIVPRLRPQTHGDQ